MKKTNKTQYRQGDVLIERIDSIPAKAIRQKQPKLVILAHGEVTGHHHSFAGTEVQEFEDDGKRFFRVSGQKMKFRAKIIRRWRQQVMVQHPKLGMIEFSVRDVTVDGKYAVVEGNFGLLQHQEHTVQGIPAGDYAGGVNGNVRQREYSPEAIRNVAD